MTDADYFNTLGVPRNADVSSTRRIPERSAVIVSERLAQHLWPDTADVIGRKVGVGSGDVVPLGIPVIGVVGDLRQLDLRTEEPTMYFPPVYGARPLTLAVRTTASPDAMANALRSAVKRVDPAQPLFDIRTMDRVLENSAERPRLQRYC